MSDSGTVLDRLFDALAFGDVDAARECLTPDARVWHGFDRIELDRDQMSADWEKLIGAYSERRIADVRRSATATGFVSQHIQILRAPTGVLMAWPVCMVVTVRDGLISRIDEYIDRAGYFTPTEGT